MPVTRRRFLTAGGAATASLTAPFAIAAGRDTSRKKDWAGGDAALHKKFGAHWYDNWTPNRGNSDREFVPMIKGAWNVGEGDFKKIHSYPGITHLLGYNEPERKDQGNLNLEKALELWPKLVALAGTKNLKLGSPAPSSNKEGMDYLDKFMTSAKRRKLRVDFVAVHWYRSREVERYAYFEPGAGKPHSLLHKDGPLTRLGELYREAGG